MHCIQREVTAQPENAFFPKHPMYMTVYFRSNYNYQARSTAVGGGPARGRGDPEGSAPGMFLKLGCKILHSGHFWHCFTMVVVVGRKSGPAKAGPAGAAATPLIIQYTCTPKDVPRVLTVLNTTCKRIQMDL